MNRCLLYYFLIACFCGPQGLSLYAQTFIEGAPLRGFRLSPETTLIPPATRPDFDQNLSSPFSSSFSSPFSASLSAAEQQSVIAADTALYVKSAPKEYPREFQFLAFYYTQAVVSSVYSANPFTGEVIGRLFGENQSRTTPGSAMYVEQRIIPFFIYQPKLFDGRAILRAAFEIDWTWGDESYLVGGNRGGAFNAGRVNIQTQNLEVELLPGDNWQINIGLQRLFDTQYNPFRTLANTMLQTGYRLAFWGSHATGITARKDEDYWRLKTGYYLLYSREIEQRNGVSLLEANVEFDLAPDWRQGFSAWYVMDRANGQAGIPTINEGLSSPLTDWNGAFRFRFPFTNAADLNNRYEADIFWLGTYGSYNPEFQNGRFGGSMFAIANLGAAYIFDQGAWQKGADIFGYAANARVGYRYGQTQDDVVQLDVLYSSGDVNGINDKFYSGVITGNTWGFPGSIFVGHGAYLVFPHGNVVNRFIGAVSDLSNIGYGVTGGVLNAGADIIPHKLSARLGAAAAISNVVPPRSGAPASVPIDNFIGWEANARLVYQLGVFMSMEFHAAHMWLGDYYNSPRVNGNASEKPTNPWTTFLAFRWLMF
jgi:hypothetical protein